MGKNWGSYFTLKANPVKKKGHLIFMFFLYAYMCICGCFKNRNAPSSQIWIQKNGFGALHFRHPYFETYPYVDHQSQDLIFPHHSHSSDKSFHFGWFPKSSKRTILHTVVKTCRCLFWGAILGNQRKWKDIGPSGCNMKRMPTCNAFWKFTSFPKQSSDGLSSFPYSSW